MHASHQGLYELAGIVVAAVAVFGLVVGAARWLFNRGAQERGIKVALDANTEATKELTGSMKHVVSTLSDHSEKLNLHEWRITKLEATPNVAVNVSPDRNSGSSG